MIVWINGAFGAGKTQTAFELHRRIPGSFIYDPEHIGFFIQKHTPSSAKVGDFQDYKTWREFNYSHLKHISGTCRSVILVPMTLVNPQYFDEIVGALRTDGVDVRHFALMASKEMLLSRLRSRGDGSKSWPAQQIDRCLSGLSNPLFHTHIDTEHMTQEQVVEAIANLSNIYIEPDTRGRVRKFLHRKTVQFQHIRILPWGH